MLTPKIDEFIVRMPKVELHVHMEGAIGPRTLLELSRRNGVAIPAQSVADVKRLFNYHNFNEFLEVFMALTRVIVQSEDFERLAYEMGLTLAAQHVLYAEVMLSPMQHLLRGISLLDAVKGAERGFQRAERETGIVVRLAMDYGRQYGPEYAWTVLDMTKKAMGHGVVAWSIGGNEIHHPPEPFADVYAAAREMGLHVMAHAGEVVGPPSVWGAVDVLKAERLGHGIRSADDAVLMGHLRDMDVTLDISPSSNVLTGAVAGWAEHPLRRLYDAGIRVTINSDDPTFFCTTLIEEYRKVVMHFGFTVDDLCMLVLNAAHASFLPPTEKQVLIHRIQERLTALRAELDV